MKTKWIIIILFCIFLFVVPSVLSAQSKDNNDNGINLTMKIKYFTCADSTGAQPCIAFNEKNKEKCRDCQKWEDKTFKREALIKNNAESYANKANFFLQVTAEELYGVDFPKNHNYPVKINDLYTNFESLGWVEVDSSGSKIGTLAIFPNIGGFIVKEGDINGKNDPANATIYFPSSKRNGAPVTMKLGYLGGMDSVKFIIPRALIEKK
jgi:hypothetical protein